MGAGVGDTYSGVGNSGVSGTNMVWGDGVGEGVSSGSSPKMGEKVPILTLVGAGVSGTSSGVGSWMGDGVGSEIVSPVVGGGRRGGGIVDQL